MADQAYPYWVRNLAFYLLDVVAFMVGFACIDPTAVLPLLLQALTQSPILIGSVMAIRAVASIVPQFVMPRYLAHRTSVKGPLVVAAIVGRIPIVLFAGWLLAGGSSGWIMLVGFVPLYGLFLVMDGCCWVPWLDILNRSIPPRPRAWFFGWMQSLSGLLAVGSGSVVGWAMNELPFPRNFGSLYGIAAGTMTISGIALAFIKEPPREPAHDDRLSLRDYTTQLRELWSVNIDFRRLIYLVMFLSLSNLAVNFYVLDAKALGASDKWAGAYVRAIAIGTAVGGLMWSMLREWLGVRAALIGLAIATSLVPALALVCRWFGPDVYAAPFVIVGVVSWSAWTLPTTYLFERFKNHRQSMVMLGWISGVYSAGLLMPVVGGVIVRFVSYPALFIVALAATVPSVFYARMLDRPSRA